MFTCTSCGQQFKRDDSELSICLACLLADPEPIYYEDEIICSDFGIDESDEFPEE